MKPLDWLRPPRAVLTLFIGLMVVCALVLGWLGWQVLVQDRAVEAQRRQEQLESAADRAVAAILRTLSSSEAEVTITANGQVEIAPAGSLPYVPAQPAPAPLAADILAEAENAEFATHDLAKAAEAYRRLADSPDPRLKAEALVRLARVLRSERRWAEVLKIYTPLEKLGATPVAGMPASLVARAARCSVLQESGDDAGARSAAAGLWNDLTAGKWSITKPTLETYLKELKDLAPDLSLPTLWEERMMMAEAAAAAFRQPAPRGRAAILAGARMASASSERQNGEWKGRVVGPSSWERLWRSLEHDTGITLRLTDADGRVLHASGPAGGQAAFRAAALTGLPWSLTATSAANTTPSRAWTARRRFLIGGLAVFALLFGLGTFLIARAISREFAVARLQSDFVAAVSHEFRTPLTSIRQLMEMLASGRMESEQHKQRAYELMLGQSDRLRRLVEALLDFGRMQGREYKFRSDPLESGEWSRAVANEFQETVRGQGYTVEFAGPAKALWVRGDREALGGALWNLLDNAVKYSPDERQVQVAVSASNGNVQVSVRDRGTGIAKDDLKRVFSKFYRGANAKKQGTKGTGIGLAMVKEIVEAHGGTVRVRSEPGKGSEFTMVLPCRES